MDGVVGGFRLDHQLRDVHAGPAFVLALAALDAELRHRFHVVIAEAVGVLRFEDTANEVRFRPRRGGFLAGDAEERTHAAGAAPHAAIAAGVALATSPMRVDAVKSGIGDRGSGIGCGIVSLVALFTVCDAIPATRSPIPDCGNGHAGRLGSGPTILPELRMFRGSKMRFTSRKSG